MWEDLAEVRTLAASDAWRGKGVGHALVDELLAQPGRWASPACSA